MIKIPLITVQIHREAFCLSTLATLATLARKCSPCCLCVCVKDLCILLFVQFVSFCQSVHRFFKTTGKWLVCYYKADVQLIEEKDKLLSVLLHFVHSHPPPDRHGEQTQSVWSWNEISGC